MAFVSPFLIQLYNVSLTLQLDQFMGSRSKIVGIIDDHYVVKTYKGLRKVKIDMKNRRNINDEIKVEKL